MRHLLQRMSFKPKAKGGWTPPPAKTVKDGGWLKAMTNVTPAKKSKGYEYTWTLTTDYGSESYGPISPRDHQAALAREAEARRLAAVQRLWDGVCRDVLLRHPDPATSVRLYTMTIGGGVRVVLEFSNMLDTSSDSYRLSAFRHGFSTDMWPGRELAEVMVVANFVQYMMHESMELATRSSGAGSWKRVLVEGSSASYWTQRRQGHLVGCECQYCRLPVVDPHDDLSWHQEWLRRSFYGTANDDDIVNLISIVVGGLKANRLVNSRHAKAVLELHNELQSDNDPVDQ